MSTNNINSLLLTTILLIALLYYGKFLLLPLSLALFIFVIIKSLSKKLIDSIFRLFNIKINDLIAVFTIFLILTLVIYSFIKILNFNLKNVIEKSSYYQNNLQSWLVYFLIMKLKNLFN